MRVAVISDIHANLTAFEAVVADFGTVEEVWCLGDVVGYGPDPDECVRLLRSLPGVVGVVGNHDWAAVGRVPADDFNREARSAVAWTASHLGAASREYLLALPAKVEREGWTLVHGSPRDPIWEYTLYTWQAAACFHHFATPGCLIGHSHIPLIFEQTEQRGARARYVDPTPGAPYVVGAARVIVNPGSVGQPRDANPRASYVLLDTAAGRLELRRVAYDVEATQARMRAAGLPAPLWQRLSYGL